MSALIKTLHIIKSCNPNITFLGVSLTKYNGLTSELTCLRFLLKALKSQIAAVSTVNIFKTLAKWQLLLRLSAEEPGDEITKDQGMFTELEPGKYPNIQIVCKIGKKPEFPFDSFSRPSC